MKKINPNEITIKSCTVEDIAFIADYISNCSEEFLRSFGADKKKVPPTEILIENLRKNLDDHGIVKNFAIAYYNGQRIGHCNVNNIVENDSGVIHAQIWDASLRNVGVASSSLIKACDHFFDLLNFKKIIFKVPHINASANGVMNKMGLPVLGSVIYEFPLMIEPIACNLYEVDKITLDKLKNKLTL